MISSAKNVDRTLIVILDRTVGAQAFRAWRSEDPLRDAFAKAAWKDPFRPKTRKSDHMALDERGGEWLRC
jgi:hypothetical protein